MTAERKPLADMNAGELYEAAMREYQAVYGRRPNWQKRAERGVA